MKKMRRITVSVLTVLLIMCLSTCTKNVAGPKGDAGEPGATGNAKQFHTSSFAQPAAAWSFSVNWWISAIYLPEITKSVKEKGEVIVYMQVGTQWWRLPYAVGDVFMQPAIEEGKVLLKYFEIHDGPPVKPGDLKFRVVVISPV